MNDSTTLAPAQKRLAIQSLSETGSALALQSVAFEKTTALSSMSSD